MKCFIKEVELFCATAVKLLSSLTTVRYRIDVAMSLYYIMDLSLFLLQNKSLFTYHPSAGQASDTKVDNHDESVLNEQPEDERVVIDPLVTPASDDMQPANESELVGGAITTSVSPPGLPVLEGNVQPIDQSDPLVAGPVVNPPSPTSPVLVIGDGQPIDLSEVPIEDSVLSEPPSSPANKESAVKSPEVPSFGLDESGTASTKRYSVRLLMSLHVCVMHDLSFVPCLSRLLLIA